MKKIWITLLLICSCLTGCTNTSISISNPTVMTMLFYNAGKADAMVIKTDQGNVLIDTGLEENASALVESLKNDDIQSLYAIIVTHYDADHAGGVSTILENFSVQHVYTTYTSENDTVDLTDCLKKAGIEAETVTSNTVFTLSDSTFTIYPANSTYDKNAKNNVSLITEIQCGSKSYLFMGDAQKERINEFLNTYSNTVDFIKMPYHGHYMNCLTDMLNTLSPSDAVITCSKTEPDAEEQSETASLLKEKNITAYYTYNGEITVTCSKDTYTITQ